MGLIRLALAFVVAGEHFWLLILGRNGLAEGSIHQLIRMNAGQAVMLFYVISGFLISYVLAAKYSQDLEGVIRFYRNRFIRIFSLYWPLLAVCVLVMGYPGHGWFDALISIVVLGGDWVLAFSNYPHERTPFPDALGQIWSVSAELTFYLLAPWLLRSARVSLICLAASLALRIYLDRAVGFHQAWTYHFFPTALCFFLFGHFARLAHDTWFKLPTWAGAVLLAASLLMIGSAISFSDKYFYLGTICFALALPSIFNATKNIVALNLLGHASYPVYLTHMMLLSLFVPVGPAALFTRDPIALLVAFLAFVFAVSVGVYFLVERPAAKLIAVAIP